ncbi:hypothetical protein M1N08_00480 [Dehalococcoidia bacterium]|nr:hypothetical protein [Dehalococcoidia bacterium]
MYIAAMAKTEESYQHIDPSAKEHGLGFAAPTPQARRILKQVKYLGSQGFK